MVSVVPPSVRVSSRRSPRAALLARRAGHAVDQVGDAQPAERHDEAR